MPFGKQKGHRIPDEVQDAGAIESDAEEGINCRQHQWDKDAGLRERQDREEKSHADDTHVPEFPEPQGCFGGQVIGIDVQIVHLQEKSRRVSPAASSKNRVCLRLQKTKDVSQIFRFATHLFMFIDDMALYLS